MAISNQPSASEINVELGRAATAPFSINGTEERNLAGVPTGPISFSDFIGKSAGGLDATMTAGFRAAGPNWGYHRFQGIGSMTPTLFNDKSGIQRDCYMVNSFSDGAFDVGIIGGFNEADLDFMIATVEVTGPGVNWTRNGSQFVRQGFDGNGTFWRVFTGGNPFTENDVYSVIFTV